MKKNRTFSSLKPISSLLPDNVKKLIKNRPHGDLEKLKNSWAKIIGDDLAGKSEVQKIQKFNSENSIFLKVSKEHLIDVDYSRDEMIEKINAYLGFKFVNKILINVKENYKDPQISKKTLNFDKKLKNIVETIEDEELKTKLLNLGNINKK